MPAKPKKRRASRARSKKTSVRQFVAESDRYVARVPAAKRKARAAQSRATSATKKRKKPAKKKKSFVAKNVQVGSDSRSKERASGFTVYANPPKKKAASKPKKRSSAKKRAVTSPPKPKSTPKKRKSTGRGYRSPRVATAYQPPTKAKAKKAKKRTSSKKKR